MTKQTRINITTLLNTSAVRFETRNDRELMIVPSATLPDNVIMNGIKYPAAEIAASFMTLNRTPAPFGHPVINGKFVSASDPEGINIGYIGAWNENVRQENGRVLLDKVIDVTVANQTENGKAVIAAINKGGPIHTSTGLLAELEPISNADDHKFEARKIFFDHDAILLNESGAATPEKGVGMLVNGQEVEVINSFYQESDRDLQWALDSAVRALEKREKAGLMERIKSAVIEAFTSTRETPALNEKELDIMADEKKLDELSATVNTLAENLTKIEDRVAEAIANAVKPLVEAQAAMIANKKAEDDAELTGLVAKIVAANILDEESAKELTINAARKLAEKAKPGKAAALNGASAFGGAPASEFAGYSLNSPDAEVK